MSSATECAGLADGFLADGASATVCELRAFAPLLEFWFSQCQLEVCDVEATTVTSVSPKLIIRAQFLKQITILR